MSKEIGYYIWKGDPLDIEVGGEVDLKDGGRIYTTFGKVQVLEGDAVSLDFGASRQVYTRSGRAYEPEYPHGKLSLHGVGGFVVLNAQTHQQAQYTQSTRDVFDQIVEKQKARVAPQLPALKEAFAQQESERREQQRLAREEADKKMREKIRASIQEMSNHLNPKKKI